jgi:predicted nicotinamide N-methyase
MELGAGTALPSIMAGLLGARRVVVTDYPAPAIMSTLKDNVVKNIRPDFVPREISADLPEIQVYGHEWGVLNSSDPICSGNKHSFDRIFVCDCLWMPEQHTNLHRSISYFLRADAKARAWVIAGFHTGRQKLRSFFDATALATEGMEIDAIWERECNGNERLWTDEGEEEDKTLRKRWLVVASLKRTSTFLSSS